MRTGKKQRAADLQAEEDSGPDNGCSREALAKGKEEQHLTRPSDCRAAARASTSQEKEQQQLAEAAGPNVRSHHAMPMEGIKQPVVNPAAAQAIEGGRARHAAAKREEGQQLLQQGQASIGGVPKRRRQNPAQDTQPEAPSAASPDEDPKEGRLDLLPEGVLDHVMSLLAAEEGGNCVRSTCRWLRSAFDRCNTRLVLRGTDEQLPDSFPTRLLDLVRHSPCVSSLTLAAGMQCVTWPQVLEAGGPQLLQRLERLTLIDRPHVLDLEALAACTRLQHLCLHGDRHYQLPALQLQLLAACGGTLRHLEIQDCSSVRDFTPLAACAALQHLTLGACNHLMDLTPLTACVQLQQLRLKGSPKLQDLSPLSAFAQLQTLHITGCPQLTDLGPLAACVALRELDLSICYRISVLAPLASCAALQHLDLAYCHPVQDLGPLAACTDLRDLKLWHCIQLNDLAPLASCAALQRLDLLGCRRVRDLGPLAACVNLRQLTLAYTDSIHDLGPLSACVALRTLDLQHCAKVDDVGPLASCVGLQVLKLVGCKMLEDLSPLAACTALQELSLEECRRVVDLGPLAACVGLLRLNLWECTKVHGLGPLAACVGLQTLVLGGCCNVRSLRPLAACLGLESLGLRGCGAQDRSSLAALPRLRIIQ